MYQQNYVWTTNNTAFKGNWSMLGGEKTEDINDLPTPG